MPSAWLLMAGRGGGAVAKHRELRRAIELAQRPGELLKGFQCLPRLRRFKVIRHPSEESHSTSGAARRRRPEPRHAGVARCRHPASALKSSMRSPDALSKPAPDDRRTPPPFPRANGGSRSPGARASPRTAWEPRLRQAKEKAMDLTSAAPTVARRRVTRSSTPSYAASTTRGRGRDRRLQPRDPAVHDGQRGGEVDSRSV